MNDRTIHPQAFDFAVGGATEGAETHVALFITEADGTRTTLALHVHDALAVGATLVAHCDALAGRPVRDWQ